MADGPIADAIVRFIDRAQAPVLVEPGLDPFPLTAGSWEITGSPHRTAIHVWTEDRNLTRRVTGISGETSSYIEVSVERFGKRPGSLRILDTARPSAEKMTRRASRSSFASVLRRMLARQYAGWRIVELTGEPDLEHSFSTSCTRAFLRCGGRGVAVVGAPASGEAEGALTVGLLWLDYLRRREPKTIIESLALFLPRDAERTTCHRLRHLRKDLTSFAVFSHEDGVEHPVDITDAGNIATSLVNRAASCVVIPSWLAPVLDIDGVEAVECDNGISLRVRGLEFARAAGTEIRFGIDSRRPARERHANEILALATELARYRSADAPPDTTLRRLAPERWLESAIRRDVSAIDAALQPALVYEQAPTIASGERGVIDLLAVTHTGRLTVIEIKATEDLHLPLQALDYWARVKWHLDHGDFERSGYFRGITLDPRPPRMLLVAPALHFHPTTASILRFFPLEAEVECVGVAAGWRSELKVISRQSHV